MSPLCSTGFRSTPVVQYLSTPPLLALGTTYPLDESLDKAEYVIIYDAFDDGITCFYSSGFVVINRSYFFTKWFIYRSLVDFNDAAGAYHRKYLSKSL